MTETLTAQSEATRLLPSDYIERGGWCKGKLNTRGWFSRKRRRPQSQSSYDSKYCVVGAVRESRQDGYISLSQAHQYIYMMGDQITPTDWLNRLIDRLIIRVLGRSRRNRFAVIGYNDNVCASLEEAVQNMRQIEVAMGLRPDTAPTVPGVRNNLERQREVLAVNSEDQQLVDEPQAVRL